VVKKQPEPSTYRGLDIFLGGCFLLIVVCAVIVVVNATVRYLVG
jgi:hypothetical protein